MPGEYWRQIEAERIRMEEERRKRERDEKSRRDGEDRDRRHREAKRVKNHTLEESREREKTEAAIDKLWKIFEDIKSNSPEIRKEPLRSLERHEDTVILKWGSKFELTPSEREFINTHLKAKFISAEHIPEQIQVCAFDNISASVYSLHSKGLELRHRPYVSGRGWHDAWWNDGRIELIPNLHVSGSGGDRFNAGEFLEKPEIIFPTLLEYLNHPVVKVVTYRKGVNYWMSQSTRYKRQHPDHVPVASYDNNCCCT